MPTRLISFAGSTITIEYDADQAAHLVDFLYHFILPVANGQPTPHKAYHLQASDGQLRLYEKESGLCRTGPAAVVAEYLLGETCYQLAQQSQGGLLFHAAGLARQNKGLLLPGTMGAGKSTLAAWLVSRGFDYLSDELVFIPDGTDTMRCFARPLNLKHPSRLALQDQLDYAAQSEHILTTPALDLVPAYLFNPNTTVSQPPLKLIIFPHYQAGAEFDLSSLSKAQAGLAAMQCLVNARNLTGHGFAEISRLAAQVPAYKLDYACFSQIGHHIETLMDTL